MKFSLKWFSLGVLVANIIAVLFISFVIAEKNTRQIGFGDATPNIETLGKNDDEEIKIKFFDNNILVNPKNLKIKVN